MEASLKLGSDSDAPLQLLLFVDKRPTSSEKIRRIRAYLDELRAGYPFDLQIVDVSEQPHLAEHYRLIATPTLIKVHPEPRQTLAGSNLVAQLETCWTRWQRSAEEFTAQQAEAMQPIQSIALSSELMRLSDEIFRLQQEKEELQAQVQFKDRLIAILAHDLRNPLTAVSIALETMAMGIELKPDGTARLTPTMSAQLLKHARTQTKAIDRMITEILQAAQGAEGNLQIQPQKVDLRSLCLEVVAHLHEHFQTKSLQIHTDLPSGLPSVLADSARVRQVLMNLLDNAIKYTPEHGKIHLSTLHRTTQKVQVSICDTGPGIPEADCDRIFEDHYRLERDTDKEGYGLGLALCRRIIRAHYGHIWVDSTPNQGSCFNFTLPVFRT
ncbi:histidine kinase [Microcoleus sp. FACHB-1515]|uniref:histidine kinase n=1 Tax=Cyanophyceae TaxID=3028117 RepID=UPI00168328EA|nr:histidine kinase [Microcoleus sp. FACHB-1515]MBD2090932.1 histidine kinase [Microcoleus sp. FACHB-1515]